MQWRKRHRVRPSRSRGSRRSWLDAGGRSRTGPRDENQDRWFLDPTLAVVSDGMGGYAGGATAAQLTVDHAVDAITSVTPAERDGTLLRAAATAANEAVRRGRAGDPVRAQMGATLTMAVLRETTTERSRWLVANVGDSPAVLVPATAEVARLTVDDTVAGHLLRDGAITEEQAVAHPYRHLVFHAVGVEPSVDLTPMEVELGDGDAIVLMSDGVSDVLPLDEIGRLVRGSPSGSVAAGRVVDAAIEARSMDNATVVVLRHVASSVGDRPRR